MIVKSYSNYEFMAEQIVQILVVVYLSCILSLFILHFIILLSPLVN